MLGLRWEARIVPKPYPAEFRVRAVALVRAGRTITAAASALGISQGCLHNWVRQDQIDRGERPGLATQERAELAAARRRIRELETELQIVRRASVLFGEETPHPKGSTR
jgi:transposase